MCRRIFYRVWSLWVKKHQGIAPGVADDFVVITPSLAYQSGSFETLSPAL